MTREDFKRKLLQFKRQTITLAELENIFPMKTPSYERFADDILRLEEAGENRSWLEGHLQIYNSRMDRGRRKRTGSGASSLDFGAIEW